MKHYSKELTPKNMRCISAACPAIYEELTPKVMQCAVGSCPAIYKELTPKSMSCIVGSCPQIHERDDNYLIIGEQVNPSDVGLEEKVGQGEVLIKVPKKLIDEKQE